MEIIAHRGAHDGKVGENTVAAFERALKLGCPMIELDCRLTKDKQFVVSHGGWTVCKDKVIFVTDFTLEELVKMQIVVEQRDKCADPERQIPSLELVLREFRDSVDINIELKEKNSASVLDRLIFKMSKFGLMPCSTNRVIISSFLIDEVINFKKFNFGIRTALNWDGLSFYRRLKMLSLAHAMLSWGIEGVHISRRVADENVISFFKKRGYKVRVYDVNDIRLLSGYAKLGVDGIITNRVEPMMKALKFLEVVEA